MLLMCILVLMLQVFYEMSCAVDDTLDRCPKLASAPADLGNGVNLLESSLCKHLSLTISPYPEFFRISVLVFYL